MYLYHIDFKSKGPPVVVGLDESNESYATSLYILKHIQIHFWRSMASF